MIVLSVLSNCPAVYNGFVYPEIPRHLSTLDLVSEGLISPRIPFMQIRRLRRVLGEFEILGRRHRGGRVRSSTPAEDRYIVLSAKTNRRTTAQQMANQFLADSGKRISRKIVARRLMGGGLSARRPVVCVPLTRQHHTARLQ
ncbi:hypothetical protein TNCV_2939811 [Trichonephila clavipes]|nr:hypothetical protein TNCV_2939811 [Trichonephila clavipes]